MNLWQSKHRRFYEFALIIISLCLIISSIAFCFSPKSIVLFVWVLVLVGLLLVNFSFQQNAVANELLINFHLREIVGCTTETKMISEVIFNEKPAIALSTVEVFETRCKTYTVICFVRERPIWFLVKENLRVYENPNKAELARVVELI